MNNHENSTNLFLYEKHSFPKGNPYPLYGQNIHKNNQVSETTSRIIEIFRGQITDYNPEKFSFFGFN